MPELPPESIKNTRDSRYTRDCRSTSVHQRVGVLLRSNGSHLLTPSLLLLAIGRENENRLELKPARFALWSVVATDRIERLEECNRARDASDDVVWYCEVSPINNMHRDEDEANADAEQPNRVKDDVHFKPPRRAGRARPAFSNGGNEDAERQKYAPAKTHADRVREKLGRQRAALRAACIDQRRMHEQARRCCRSGNDAARRSDGEPACCVSRVEQFERGTITLRVEDVRHLVLRRAPLPEL